jgi:hypothetical protein
MPGWLHRFGCGCRVLVWVQIVCHTRGTSCMKHWSQPEHCSGRQVYYHPQCLCCNLYYVGVSWTNDCVLFMPEEHLPVYLPTSWQARAAQVVSDLHSEGECLEYRPVHRVSSLRLFVLFLSLFLKGNVIMNLIWDRDYFHVLSNSLVTNHPTIRRYIYWATDSIVK